MCRLFGMTAGPERLQATFWLLDAGDSLVAQSHRNADGTGLGYFDDDGRPRVDKRPIAAFDDRAFAADARRAFSSTFVAHVRHATNGGLTMANTHPFSQEGRLFAHNGVIGDVPKLERELGDDLRRVAGESDSERFFALITREIDRHGGDLPAGIRAAVGWVVDELPIVSINFVLVTPTDLWALRYPETNTLYVLDRAPGGGGGEGGGRAPGGRAPGRAAPLEQTSSHGTRVVSEQGRDRPVVVIASERMDDDPGWRELEVGELVHVGRSLEVESEMVEGPSGR
ncbi:MAG TPA: class II glutamine amidotransferase [Solirubrobacteraceae bacterium]|jgi:glutamine amidotransferase|nr:class II glutamine amidotransferase [Solirubrobacteraceae bacterium]